MNKSKTYLPKADRTTANPSKLPFSFYEKQYKRDRNSHRRMARISLVVLGCCCGLLAFLLIKSIPEDAVEEAFGLLCFTSFVGLGALFNALYSRKHARKYTQKLQAVQERKAEAWLLENRH